MTTEANYILPEGWRIASESEPGRTHFGLWITDAPPVTPTIAKEIVYDRETKDHAAYVTIDGQREYIGSGKTYHDAEIKANEYTYNYYTDNHTPEVAAGIAVKMGDSLTTALYLDGADTIIAHATTAKRDEYMRYNPSARIIDPPFEETGAPQEEELYEWEREDQDRLNQLEMAYQAQLDAPPAHRSITIGYDGEQCDLVNIAAQVLAPLAHLRPSIGRNGTYLLLTDTATIPAPLDDHAIVCNLIDRLNEVAAQLPVRPTSITAWLHVNGEIYQVGRGKESASPGGV